MVNVCERCKRPMSSHDDNASCPQCLMAAGECNLDIENPCNICGGWTSKQWGKLYSSQAGEGDFEDNLLVSTKSPLVQQVLVVQAQNGVNTGSGTATTAPITAPLLSAGPSTMEPIVPIGAQLGAQDTPSVIQGARPVVSTEQTMQSTQGYGTLPYLAGPLYTAPLPYAAYTAPLLPCLLCQQGLLYQWVIMVRAVSSLLCLTLIG